MVNDYVIIGGGISGLTLALEFLRAGQKVRLIESASALGGLAKTVEYDKYRIDYGPHLFHSAHKEIIDYWRELVGDSLVSKDFFSGNYIDGKIYDYPVNMQTAEFQYSKKEYEQIKSQLEEVDYNNLTNAENYHDYVRSLAGDYLSDRFFTKYPKKLWGIDTKDLSARFAPRRIEIREKRLPFHSGPGRFAGVIEGGCGTLAEKMKDQIISLGGEIFLNSEIVNIVKDDKINIDLRQINRDFLKIAQETLPITPWNDKTWSIWTDEISQKTGLKGRELFLPLRIALTGENSGPELAKFILLLGRDLVLSRLNI